MVLSDPAKSGLESAWCMDTIIRTKTKTLPLPKRVCYFFRLVYHSKNNVLSHPVKYFTTLKNNNNMPVKFSNYNRKLSENSYLLRI